MTAFTAVDDLSFSLVSLLWCEPFYSLVNFVSWRTRVYCCIFLGVPVWHQVLTDGLQWSPNKMHSSAYCSLILSYRSLLFQVPLAYSVFNLFDSCINASYPHWSWCIHHLLRTSQQYSSRLHSTTLLSTTWDVSGTSNLRKCGR